MCSAKSRWRFLLRWRQRWPRPHARRGWRPWWISNFPKSAFGAKPKKYLIAGALAGLARWRCAGILRRGRYEWTQTRGRRTCRKAAVACFRSCHIFFTTWNGFLVPLKRSRVDYFLPHLTLATRVLFWSLNLQGD